jgi:transcriptional regulator with GAF, ATPase, and Fis domain
VPHQNDPTILLDLIASLKEVLGGVSNPEGVLRTLLSQAVQRTGAERGVLVQVGERGALDYTVLHRFTPADVDGSAGEFSRSLFAEVLRTGEGILLANAMSSPAGGSESVRAMRLVSVLCLPIRADGRIAAIVHLEHGTKGKFGEPERRILASLLDVAGPVLEALLAGRRTLDERNQLREVLAREWSFGRFVGRSPAVRALEETVRKVGSTDFPALIIGETGTGKGIVARILHAAGRRTAKPFVTVFCPSLERGLVESELFGHRRGAFTGADQDRPGKVQAAEGGTLFLDEIGDLPVELQPKLLRLLQEKTYERLGDAVERRADVRVLAATNRDLEAEVAAGRFRRDLYERLNFLPVVIPPLRERRSDLPVLLRHLLDATDAGRWIEISPDAERWLVDLEYLWPGNVRQLEQVAARLTLEGPSRPVDPGELSRLLPVAAGGAPVADTAGLDAGLPALLERSEKEWLERALRAHPDVTRKELAARLKISEPALYKKLKEHGLGGRGTG